MQQTVKVLYSTPRSSPSLAFFSWHPKCILSPVRVRPRYPSPAASQTQDTSLQGTVCLQPPRRLWPQFFLAIKQLYYRKKRETVEKCRLEGNSPDGRCLGPAKQNPVRSNSEVGTRDFSPPNGTVFCGVRKFGGQHAVNRWLCLMDECLDYDFFHFCTSGAVPVAQNVSKTGLYFCYKPRACLFICL